MPKIRFDGIIPTRATQASAGYDLRSPIDAVIPAGKTLAIGTGTIVQMSSDIVGMVCSRSGLALRGLTVANAPGIIDADYSDTIRVILYNRTAHDFVVEAGDRIAQLVFVPVVLGNDIVAEQRIGGLGSTGA